MSSDKKYITIRIEDNVATREALKYLCDVCDEEANETPEEEESYIMGHMPCNMQEYTQAFRDLVEAIEGGLDYRRFE